MKKALIGLVAILMLVAIPLGISGSTENIAYAQDTKPKEPFTTKIENNKYAINYSGDMVYVGKGTDTFVPEITMYRFGQECSLTLYEPTINGNTLSQKNAGSTLTGDTIQWASKDIQFLFYPKGIDGQNDKGSFEYEITIANSKAGTDKILSSISFLITSNNLNFYYQPELTPEEVAEGCVRPDNVVGSYAVYHSTKRDHIIGQTNYRSGKAFHIYRPMLIDNAGNTAWADLIITDTELIIDFSKIQDWLNKAKYPVVIDPNFGYETKGATVATLENCIKGTEFTCPEAGTGNSITIWLKNSEVAKNGKCALYDGTSVVSNGTTEELSIPLDQDDWKTFNFAVAPTLANQAYRIEAWGASGDGELSHYVDSGIPDYKMYYKTETYNGWPDPLTWSEADTYRVSIYCTYTLEDGVPPDAPTNFVASDNLTDRVTCIWTKSDGATKYQVYKDGTPIGGELGDVATYDDFTATAGTITPGNSVASDGTDTAHIDLSLTGTDTNNGTTYSYKVRAGNADGWSGDSNIDDGKRIPGVLTYQWQRSASDGDAGYDNIGGAVASTYEDTGAPAPTITPGNAVATDGGYTNKVVLSLDGTSSNDGDGRWYRCVLDADGATQQTSVSNRGYTNSGALSYQWQRSAGDSDADYDNIAGAVNATYEDIDAPEGTVTPGTATASDGTSATSVTLSVAGEQGNDGAGRYYQCVLSAPDATGQTSGSNRGYRTTGAITYQWQRSATDSDANYAPLGGATTDPHNDTTVPEDEGRWYYCEISAIGVTTQDSTYDRGYLGDLPIVIPDVSVGHIILRVIPIVIAGVVCIFVIRHHIDARHLLFGAVVGLLAFIIVDAFIKLLFD